MVQEQVEIIKTGLEQSLERAMETQNSLNKTGSGTRAQTRAKPKFLLGRNVTYSQQEQQQQQQHFMPKKNYADVRAGKRDSPRKVKERNFLTNTSCNCLKHIDFDNASFVIDSLT